MKIIGLVAEYNPFHNGHLYQIKKIKEIFKDSIIICVLSTCFTERGEISILTTEEKTNIALHYGIDLVIELPYPFASQSADIFAKGSIEILNDLKINTLVFGSESNDITLLKEIAEVQINNKEFDKKVKEYLSNGNNYPTSLSLTIKDLTGKNVNLPNDILAISYIKEILKQNKDIEIYPIKRTSDYNDLLSTNKIVSATNIRNKIKENKKIKKYVPTYSYKYLKNKKDKNNKIFNLLKYKIISEKDNLNKYNTVDEGIESRIYNSAIISNNLDELIENIKTKRYTYTKVQRMLTHILTGFTKDDAKEFKDIEYIRILGMSNNGQFYLNKIKKDTKYPILSKIKKDYKMLQLELNIERIYDLITK